VEQNRDAQLRTLLMNELDADPKKLKPLLWYSGKVPDCRFVVTGIKSGLGESQ